MSISSTCDVSHGAVAVFKEFSPPLTEAESIFLYIFSLTVIMQMLFFSITANTSTEKILIFLRLSTSAKQERRTVFCDMQQRPTRRGLEMEK